MALLDEMRELLSEVYAGVTTDGLNFAARVPIRFEVYALTGGDPHKGLPGTETLVTAKSLDVVPVDLVLKKQREWTGESLDFAGDARLEIVQAAPFTRARLMGQDLAAAERAYWVVDGERHTITNGGLADLDGLTWLITLERLPQ